MPMVLGRHLSDYAGKVLLIVNVASKCGLTPQYDGLQKLYEEMHEEGLEILGFPCNQFLFQERGSEKEIETFCRVNYGVTFPMFAKIKVNGSGAHPLYKWLTGLELAPEGAGKVQWNFGKFLIGKDGVPLARFTPKTEPDAAELRTAIQDALVARRML